MPDKEIKIRLSEKQRAALLALFHAVEHDLDLKKILPDHQDRVSAYKAMKKIRTATSKESKN